jgi:hypothetical protein
MKTEQLVELLLQSLEQERAGVEIYLTALTCAVDSELKKEWQTYHEQTVSHATALEDVCQVLGVDPEAETPGRTVVRQLGQSMIDAMSFALAAGPPTLAQLVASECVLLAETKDHLDWELIGKCAQELSGDQGEALQEAFDEIEEQEDEHLYHMKGWCRELWINSLGMSAILPPPEDRKHVKTAIGAARAEQAAERAR